MKINEAIEVLEANYPTPNYTDLCNAVDLAISSLKKQKHNKWIPCSERLPDEKEDTYWICTDSGYQCECRWTNDRWGFGESDTWGWKPIDIPQYTKVVAWMPLPEPWKGVDDET